MRSLPGSHRTTAVQSWISASPRAVSMPLPCAYCVTRAFQLCTATSRFRTRRSRDRGAAGRVAAGPRHRRGWSAAARSAIAPPGGTRMSCSAWRLSRAIRPDRVDLCLSGYPTRRGPKRGRAGPHVTRPGHDVRCPSTRAPRPHPDGGWRYGPPSASRRPAAPPCPVWQGVLAVSRLKLTDAGPSIDRNVGSLASAVRLRRDRSASERRCTLTVGPTTGWSAGYAPSASTSVAARAPDCNAPSM